MLFMESIAVRVAGCVGGESSDSHEVCHIGLQLATSNCPTAYAPLIIPSEVLDFL